MNTITFKNREYTVLENHSVPAFLALDGLKAQMTIQGKHGATRFFQIWDSRFGEVYKTIDTSGVTEVELHQK